MRFRAKVFLAVLLPASLLVGISMVAALLKITYEADLGARKEFELTQRQVRGILERKRVDLKWLEQTFDKIFFRELVAGGVDPGKRAGLLGEFDAELDTLKLQYEYLGVAGKEGEVWLARYGYGHACEDRCRHQADVAWVPRRTAEALFVVDRKAILGRQITFPESGGAIVMGREIESDLADLPVRVALFHDGRPTFVSQALSGAGWEARPGVEGNVVIGGERHLAGASSIGVGDMVVLRPMGGIDQARRWTLAAGLGALLVAVLIAAGASLGVARGISRPVETLVAATRKVGEGDYTVTVDVAGRDEMADLGRAFNDMTGGLRKRREIMEKTLSRDVAEELMKGVELGGERRELTILFMDVRGFTSATEGVDPAEVVAMLNDMMGDLAGAVSRQGGNVNKFLGDGIMAMFGAPRDLPDHAFQAVQAALEMQRGMTAWNARRAGRGLPMLRIGIGINTGTAVGGRVGSRERLEYTLIGEEVNLASRICGKAAPGQVLVTKQTYDRLGGRLRANALEPVQVKGLSYPVHVYEVIG